DPYQLSPPSIMAAYLVGVDPPSAASLSLSPSPSTNPRSSTSSHVLPIITGTEDQDYLLAQQPGVGRSHSSPARRAASDASTEPTVMSSIKAALLANWYLNIAAVIFFPLGIMAHVLKWGTAASFVLNFLAIIPLAKCLDFAVDQMTLRFGMTLGVLLDISFGNAVELILGIITLKAGLLRVLLASLIGSILSNNLLALGVCFFFGGLVPFQKGKVQKFSTADANMDTGLMAVASLGFIVPASLNAVTENENGVVFVSRISAILLFLTYVMFLIFHLYTNAENPRKNDDTNATNRNFEVTHYRRPGRGVPPFRMDSSATLSLGEAIEVEEDEKERPVTLMWVAAVELLMVTMLIAVSGEFLVSSLDDVSEALSSTFVGIILLPICKDAADHFNAASSSMRALFVMPLLVLVGWMIGQPLTLNFEIFETVVLFASTNLSARNMTRLNDPVDHSAFTWIEEPAGIFWANGCDRAADSFESVVAAAAGDCALSCTATSVCTNFAWAGDSSGTCWMNNGSFAESDAITSSVPGIICGGFISTVWSTGSDGSFSARNCNWDGSDIKIVQLQATDCVASCVTTSGCTNYAWSGVNGGLCWLKGGNLPKSAAKYSAEDGGRSNGNLNLSSVCTIGVNWTVLPIETTDNKRRACSGLLYGLRNYLPIASHPLVKAAATWPGISASTIPVTSKTWLLNPTHTRWLSTQLYVTAGTSLNVTFCPTVPLNGTTDTSALAGVQIGSTTDELTKSDSWNRFPIIHEFSVEWLPTGACQSLNVTSYFGGLLFLDIAEQGSLGSVTVRGSVTTAPYYNGSQTVADWNASLQTTKSLYGEMEFNGIAFTYPLFLIKQPPCSSKPADVKTFFDKVTRGSIPATVMACSVVSITTRITIPTTFPH
ncbi:hypothetical protein HK405_010496, partial [Cladochytrium tenue]